MKPKNYASTNHPHGNRGRKRPDLSARNKTLSNRQNVSKALRGRIRSEEHSLNISIAKLGFRPSEPTRTKMSIAHRGERNANWRGGIYPANQAARRTQTYKQWKQAVFQRDDYTCQCCKARGVPLHADHVLPFAFYPDLRVEILNGRTLCIPCHKLTPTYNCSFDIYAQ